MVVEQYVGLDGRCEFILVLKLMQVVHLDFQGTQKLSIGVLSMQRPTRYML